MSINKDKEISLGVGYKYAVYVEFIDDPDNTIRIKKGGGYSKVSDAFAFASTLKDNLELGQTINIDGDI